MDNSEPLYRRRSGEVVHITMVGAGGGWERVGLNKVLVTAPLQRVKGSVYTMQVCADCG